MVVYGSVGRSWKKVGWAAEPEAEPPSDEEESLWLKKPNVKLESEDDAEPAPTVKRPSRWTDAPGGLLALLEPIRCDDESRGRSRSRSRSSRSSSRVTAKPKPMPKRMAKRPGVLGPVPPSTPPPPALLSRLKILQPILMTSYSASSRPGRPASYGRGGMLSRVPPLPPDPPQFSAWPPERPMPIPVAMRTLPVTPPRNTEDEDRAREVLARHSARLGDFAGSGLEQALRVAHGKRLVDDRWSFLDDPEGWELYAAEKKRFAEIYSRHGRGPVGEPFVMEALQTGRSVFGLPVLPTAAGVSWHSAGDVLEDGTVELLISDVRFAHNDQSEKFGRGGLEEGGAASRSLLQLAVELVTGVTDPEVVPSFTVCSHDDLWYCRSGNRRLAAFRLAHRYRPVVFDRVRMPVVRTDDAFWKPINGRLPKLTTQRNGAVCKGRWLVVRETGELVGHETPGRPEYGADLLVLLQPPPEDTGPAQPFPPKPLGRSILSLINGSAPLFERSAPQ